MRAVAVGGASTKVNAAGARPSNEADGMTKALLAMCAMTATFLGAAVVAAQPRPGYLEVWSEPPAEIVLDGNPTGLDPTDAHPRPGPPQPDAPASREAPEQLRLQD